jgi:hypothetical protein
MQTRLNRTGEAGADRHVLNTRNADTPSRPAPSDPDQRQAAATAEFERLMARLRQLVGATNPSR